LDSSCDSEYMKFKLCKGLVCVQQFSLVKIVFKGAQFSDFALLFCWLIWKSWRGGESLREGEVEGCNVFRVVMMSSLDGVSSGVVVFLSSLWTHLLTLFFVLKR